MNCSKTTNKCKYWTMFENFVIKVTDPIIFAVVTTGATFVFVKELAKELLELAKLGLKEVASRGKSSFAAVTGATVDHAVAKLRFTHHVSSIVTHHDIIEVKNAVVQASDAIAKASAAIEYCCWQLGDLARVVKKKLEDEKYSQHNCLAYKDLCGEEEDIGIGAYYYPDYYNGEDEYNGEGVCYCYPNGVEITEFFD